MSPHTGGVVGPYDLAMLAFCFFLRIFIQQSHKLDSKTATYFISALTLNDGEMMEDSNVTWSAHRYELNNAVRINQHNVVVQYRV